MGGRFRHHPPRFDFMVTPLSRAHPTTAGMSAFSVHDEFYYTTYDETVQIHTMAFDRGVAHPMSWTKNAGSGRVAFIAPGHHAQVWNLPVYRQWIRQSVAWLLGDVLFP
jgi:type 1 glutamine amidotransferase